MLMRSWRTIGLAALTAAGVVGYPSIGRADDPVIYWNQQLIGVIQQISALLVNGPPEVARQMSIVDSAMFDAANAASGSVYTPMAYGGGSVAGASVTAAALAAGHTAMQGIFANSVWSGSGGSATVQANMLSKIDNAYTTAISSMGVSLSDPGIALGQSAANATLAQYGYTVGNNGAGATDGSYAAIINGLSNNAPAGSGTVKGVYVPPTARPEMFPTWGSVTPAGLTTAQVHNAESKIPGPPAITSRAYSDALMLTACGGSGFTLGAALASACAAAGIAPQTTAQNKAALFWNDPGTTLQPPAHWLQIVNTVAASQGLNTLQSARLSALLSQAEFDAGIAAWDIKYADNLWRPIAAIRDCSGWSTYFTACDPNWSSLIATPPHPDYVAGHPAFSGAGATVLENFFGTDNISFTSVSDEYCNGGTTWRSQSTGLVTACTITAGTSPFAYLGGNTIYSDAGGCVDAGGTTGTDGSGNATCTLDGTTFTYNPAASGCNDIVNGGSNDSLLICPITETFDSFSAASSGPNGSEFSRIAGGIHTPFAVADALTVGNEIGMMIASDNNIPEPMSLVLFPGALAGLAAARRRSRRLVSCAG